jgi:hypothetical protein
MRMMLPTCCEKVVCLFDGVTSNVTLYTIERAFRTWDTDKDWPKSGMKALILYLDKTGEMPVHCNQILI